MEFSAEIQSDLWEAAGDSQTRYIVKVKIARTYLAMK